MSLADEYSPRLFLDDQEAIFKLREVVQPLIKYVIDNGNTTFLWLDYWHDVSPLYKVFGGSIVNHVDSSLFAKVSSIVHNGNRHWPRQRNRAIMKIIRNTPPTFRPNPEIDDSMIWIPTSNGKFSAKSALEALGTPLPKVPWAPIVWFKQGIPR